MNNEPYSILQLFMNAKINTGSNEGDSAGEGLL